MIELGDKVQDNVSEIVGIAVSEIRYLNGCHQIGVQSRFKNGKMPSVEYIDIGQLTMMEKQAVVIAKEEDQGGAQAYAPGSRIKSGRMDHVEIGASIGKPRE